MKAVVLAGGIPSPTHPLYPYTRGKPRALMKIAGRPMLQWVLGALESSQSVEEVILAGLEERWASDINTSLPLTTIPDCGSSLENAYAALLSLLRDSPSDTRVLILSADIPALRSESVAWAVATALQYGGEGCYFVVTREVMEAQFPGASRTYIRFKDVTVCGADLAIIDPALIHTHSDLWKRLAAARKHPLRQAALIGPGLLLGMALRRFTLAQVAERVMRRLGVRGCVVPSPYADIAMDADTPAQMRALQQYLLAERGSSHFYEPHAPT